MSGVTTNGSSAGLWAVVEHVSLSQLLHDVERIQVNVPEIQSSFWKLIRLPLALSLTKLSEEFQVMEFHFTNLLYWICFMTSLLFCHQDLF